MTPSRHSSVSPKNVTLRGNRVTTPDTGNSRLCRVANKGIASIQNSSLNSNSLISFRRRSDISSRSPHTVTRGTFSGS